MRPGRRGAREGADPVGIGFAPKLVHPALLRRLVGPPAQEFGAVAEAAAADMVVADLGDELGPQRLPLGAPRVAPAARPAGCVAGEARRLDQRLQPPGELRLFA